ncbi:similar to tRNA-specific adenosine deaminase [Plenodomus lingam JN3]|uniref:Similar to tRNA-specific adenosine deaminase n=1 Tax=Leptosphaeria maculans (strain JN3 / isolate v23.1.3 / race Av1-4-5-6-7-8) TaxID=985895 RepID=E5AA33_LEPMJ|nr:similar to tRNA-specific adenosine deaminase [Plenodomus lingam JN3]CBY00524.1 similar to tRNA-specific adenosine deaminase [Plenodomus lingam JN3]
MAKGTILHDWHAEVVAIRAFNRYLLDQCLQLSTPPYTPSDFLRQRSADEYTDSEYQPFTIKDNVRIHMYCSEAPCGDASMELVMSTQEDATPWTTAPATVTSPSASTSTSKPPPPTPTTEAALRGRTNFSLLGLVRCKPSRPDAPPTLSKSCTDKLALAQATSLLTSTTTLFLSPSNAYLTTLILPTSQHIPSACSRAFSRSGRLGALSDAKIQGWKGGYKFRPFEVMSTTREFRCCRRAVLRGEKAVPSNLSAVWTPTWQETLIGGVLQGRKQGDVRGASRICRKRMWGFAMRIAGVVEAVVGGRRVLGKRTYGEVRTDEVFDARTRVKEDMKSGGLQGWVGNRGDEEFSLDEVRE